MNRKLFLTVVAIIATAVGLFALAAPAALVASKGAVPCDAAYVWVREVGIALVAIGVLCWLVRGAPDSATLRAVLVGNLILQLGLLPIEVLAYRQGVLTAAAGVIPNSILHVTLVFGFGFFAVRMKRVISRPSGAP